MVIRTPPQEAQSSRKLAAPEAARHLNLSASTLAKMRVYGGGPRYYKLGRRVVYDVAELESWAEQRLCESTSESAGDGQ